MAFIPYVITADRLPKLRRGHVFKVGNKFYQITATRRWRKQWADAVAYPEPGQEWSVKGTPGAGLTVNDYAALTGDVNLSRITHLQYLALSTALAVTLRWKDKPLLTMTNLDPLTANLAGLAAAPLELDKWTYDTTMHIKLIKLAGAQTFTVEGVEYDIEPTDQASTYCELFPDGSYQFVGY